MTAEEVEPSPSRALVAMPSRPVEPAGLRIGTVFYLLSVGLIAAATLGASLGIGFYLLVHPPQEAAAEPARSSEAEPVQEFTSPTSEASAPIPSAALSAAALPVRPAFSPGLESLSSEAGPEPAQPKGGGGQDRLSSLQEADHLTVRDNAPDTNSSPLEGEARDQNRDASPHGRADEPAGEPSHPTEVVNGIVTGVRDVATWVVGGRTIRLSGISPGPPKLLPSLVNWVRAKGLVECLPQAGSLSYRCFTATGEDIAEAALLAGIGRAGDGATAAYEGAQSSARRMGKGLWARR
jgi:endonuclease YncB( thermonuclease family)